jgi:Mce-associated membrane protein
MTAVAEERKTKPGIVSRIRRTPRNVAILSAVCLVLAVATGVLAFFWMNGNGADTARTNAVSAAETDVPELLSYSSATFSSDLAKAEAATTPQFRSTYEKLMTSQIEPSAKAHQVVTSSTVSAAAVVNAQPKSAALLLFLNQQTKTATKAEPVLNSIAVQVEMTNVNGTWLVAGMTPPHQ